MAGQVLSYPSVSDAVVDEVWSAGHADAADRLSRMCELSDTFFLVSDMRANHKKRLRTAVQRARDEAIAMPVLLQRIVVRADPDVVDYPMIYHDAYPTMTDLIGAGALACVAQRSAEVDSGQL